ncbi:MAG TPA: hypothetical protein VKH61_22020 [Streptosporangiaceae bacterium]|nr:hypothetical protein [Streptosporangiaceae bacterium]
MTQSTLYTGRLKLVPLSDAHLELEIALDELTRRRRLPPYAPRCPGGNGAFSSADRAAAHKN